MAGNECVSTVTSDEHSKIEMLVKKREKQNKGTELIFINDSTNR